MQMKHDGLVEFSNNLGSVEYLAGSMMEQLITFVEINVCFSIDDDYVGCVDVVHVFGFLICCNTLVKCELVCVLLFGPYL